MLPSTTKRENRHGPHNNILPQSGVSCQRPNRPRQHWHPLVKEQRLLCTACHNAFTATKGTAFYRLRTAAETVNLVVTLMAHGRRLQHSMPYRQPPPQKQGQTTIIVYNSTKQSRVADPTKDW